VVIKYLWPGRLEALGIWNFVSLPVLPKKRRPIVSPVVKKPLFNSEYYSPIIIYI